MEIFVAQIWSVLPFPLFFCGFPILVIILIIWTSQAEKAKLERFMRFALEREMTFMPALSTGFGPNVGFFGNLFATATASSAFLAKYEGFQPVSRLNGATVKYIFEGQLGGHEYEAFQYQYTTSNGKSSTTHYFQIASIVLPMWAPHVKVSEHGFLDGLGKIMGMQDIQLESEEFNKRFLVQGQDEKFVFDLLHPEMMEMLMRNHSVDFQLNGNRLLVYRTGQIDEEFVMMSRAYLSAFWEKVPGYVRQDRGAGS